MTRNVIKIAVFIVHGAIVNLAVAWACSAFNIGAVMLNLNLTTPLVTTTQEARDAWTAAYGESVFVSSFDESRTLDPEVVRTTEIYGSMSFWIMESREVGLGTERHHLTDMLRSIPPHMMVVRAGWPMQAFQSVVISGPQGARGTPRVWVTQAHNGLELRWPLRGGPGSRRIDLPYRPIMPGFAVNTVLYAGVVCMLFAAPVAIQRHRRLKRGLCVHCAYDLRGGDHQRCPECGATRVAPRRKRPG